MRLVFARTTARPARLDPRTKVVALLLVSILLVVLERPFSLALVTAGCLLAMLAARPAPRTLLVILGLAALGVWGTMLGQSIFYAEFPRTPILTLVSPRTPVLGRLTGGIALYLEGFYHGALQSLRLLAALCLGLALIWTTDAAELVRALIALRIPYGLAFMTATALRFVPVVLDEARMIFLTRRLRGARLWTGSPWRACQNVVSAVRPLFFSNLRRATVLADSIESRAFSPSVAARVGATGGRPLRVADLAVLGTIAALVVSVVALKLLYLSYLGGWTYHPALRAWYVFAREHL